MAISAIEFLHDAILKEININWEDGSASISFQVNEVYVKGENLFTISIIHITDFNLPRLFPWGKSVYVNKVSYNEKKIEIEMQSGDVIKIFAKEFNFPKPEVS